MTRPSLFVRYWLVMAALVSLPLVAVATLAGVAAWNDSRNAALERQRLEARRLALEVERYVLPAIDRLKLMSSLPWGYPSADVAAFEAEARRIVVQHPLVDRIQRVAPDGAIAAHFAQDGRRRALGPEERKAIAGLAVDREGAPVPIVVGRDARGDWSVALPERGGGHAIVADLRIEVIGDWLRRTPDRSVDLIVDARDVLIAHPERSWVESRRSLRELDGWAGAPVGTARGAAEAEGVLGEIDAIATADPSLGRRWFGAWRRIEPVGWTAIALAPAGPLKARMREAVLRSVLVLIAANVLAVALAWYFAKRLSGPIAAISSASGRVAAGDLDARATVAGDGPVAKLATQFNAMVDELRQSYGLLEQRVAAKTAELDAANRHKSAFLAQMSHELRTPLNAVIGFSTSLRAQYFGPLNDKQREYVGYILASGQHLLSLINDLLDLSKIEAGRMELDIAPVDAVALCESSVELLRMRAQQQGVEVAASVDPDARTFRGDARKIKQVLINLLSNAVKFTPAGGRVDIRVERAHEPSPGIRFAVRDTGCGIAPEHAGRLFEDFGQLPQDDRSPAEGTGLGLAVSRRLVELHGGAIGVDSAPGAGSTFWFVLPERA